MTNEQLTQTVMELEKNQSKCMAEHEKFELLFKNIQDDIKTTKNLAEDVHIMALNMKTMQESQSEMNKKIDALTSKEYVAYKESKKRVKEQIISIVIGAIGTGIIGFIIWLINMFIQSKGGI